ncbi:hypothetical protein OsJ_11398 [Oryza sativa Japonica Group]|uniref:AB hydrolase-1 domain-containing protein n=1 Tax=Oryza sativa subsp. japonica TaxID=39947 RepID=A3AJG0_ORYSJ|nr:hypothetical protein OsJ_11398 [Oryza sativa Japonica Group]
MGIVEEAHNLRVVGEGKRGVIVLAHGFGTDQSVWKHLVPHLVADYRVGYALDLLAILQELRVASCIYVGHSVSAVIGAIASISRPDLFSKLVLLSASPRHLQLVLTLDLTMDGWGVGCIEPPNLKLDSCIVKTDNLQGVLLYLNDVDYYGGFEQEDLDELFEAMGSNYKAWCSGFAPLCVGGDMESVAVQEFSRTLFNIRPDIALSVAQTIFQSDVRSLLPLVTVPCHIVQSTKDLAVPVVVSEYLHKHLGGDSIVEVMPSEGHLPQLSSPDIVIPVLLRHIQHDIAV